jgi:hypothetical protein
VQQFLQWKINITYSRCVVVALDIHHAMCMHHIISGLPRYTLFFHILVNGTIFEKKIYLTQIVGFDCRYNFCLKHFSF